MGSAFHNNINASDKTSGPKPKSRDDTGLFTWDLGNDRFYSDSLVVELFGFDAADAEMGLPITALMDRVHIDDRKRVAKGLHQSIVSSEPIEEEFRIVGVNRPPVDAMIFGRCFRDGDGDPISYTGVVFPLPNVATSGYVGLLRSCATALEIASREGNEIVAAKLRDVVTMLDPSAVRQVPATIVSSRLELQSAPAETPSPRKNRSGGRFWR